MIEPTQLSLHQNIAFLVKSDLVQRDVMQSLARQVAREFAMADMVAANRPVSTPNADPNSVTRSGIDGSLVSIEAIAVPHQLHYPLVLKRALQKFGLDEAMFNTGLEQTADEITRREKEQSSSNDSVNDEEPESDNASDNDQGSESDSASESGPDSTAVDLTDIAVFRAVDQLLPELQNLGQCAGMQLSFYRAPEHINGMWKHRHIIVMLPIDGELGQQRAAFTFLLRRDFAPISIPGKLSLQPGSLIQPWPCQELVDANKNDLVMQARLQLEGNDIAGKSFLMGMISKMLPPVHWFEYDHRDVA